MDVDWTDLPEDSDKWRAFVKNTINHWVDWLRNCQFLPTVQHSQNHSVFGLRTFCFLRTLNGGQNRSAFKSKYNLTDRNL